MFKLFLILALAVAVGLIIELIMQNKRLGNAFSQIKDYLKVYQRANEEANSEYYITKLAPKGWSVIKISRVDDQPILMKIKDFIDEDDSFSYREAEELLNTLKQ